MIKHHPARNPWKKTGENPTWLTAETQTQKVAQKLKLCVLTDLFHH